jgi:hypothetical protein
MNKDVTGVVNNEAIAKIQDNILDIIINPILGLATAVAFVLFIWGMVRFLINRNTNPEESSKGKKHLLWGIIALFILVSIWSIFIGIGKLFSSNIWFVK